MSFESAFRPLLPFVARVGFDRHAPDLSRSVRVGDIVRAVSRHGSGRPVETRFPQLASVTACVAVARGQRVTYLGSKFELVEVSDTKRLVGLELRCEPAAPIR